MISGPVDDGRRGPVRLGHAECMTAQLPEDLCGRPFTVAHGLRRGVTARVLDGPRFRTPVRGVRVHRDVPDTLELLRAALLLVLPRPVAFSHATAATLCGLPLPDALDPRRPVQVCVPSDADVPHLAGTAGHEGLDGGRVISRDGLPVVQPMRTWCDLAPRLSLDDAVILGDAVLRRWGTPDRLAEVVASRAGERGVVRMRRLLPLLRSRVDSPMETRTRLVLVRGGLPEPVCGRDVHAEDGGGWLAVPDLSWPTFMVALEYDGDVHRTDRRQWKKDVRRREILQEHGWHVIVATADDVLVFPNLLVARVRKALCERGLAC